MDRLDSITAEIIGAAIEVHRELGPGLLETTYESCLEAVLLDRGLAVRRQHALPLTFRGRHLEGGYRLDLLVEASVVVEVKSVSRLEAVHFAQMLTYLKLTGCEVGLLVNFNVSILKDGGIRRVVRGYRGGLG